MGLLNIRISKMRLSIWRMTTMMMRMRMMKKMRTRKKMRMKKRKRKKISKNLILDFFAVPICIFFLYRMVIFLYLFLLFVACINEWAKPFYSPLICLCGFAMLCVVSPKLKKCFVFLPYTCVAFLSLYFVCNEFQFRFVCISVYLEQFVINRSDNCYCELILIKL